jgi:hypothetical protein
MASLACAAKPSPGLTLHTMTAPTWFAEADDVSCFETPNVRFEELGITEPCDQYQLTVTNSGSEAAKPPIVIEDKLPGKLREPEGSSEQFYLARNEVKVSEDEAVQGERLEDDEPCEDVEESTVVRCVFGEELQPDQRLEVDFRVKLEPGAQSGETNVAEVSEAGTVVASSETRDVVTASDESPGFGTSALVSQITGVDGRPDSQAGAHPYEFVTRFDMNTRMGPTQEPAGAEIAPASVDLRDVVVDLPVGFLGSAQATPKCPLSELQGVAQCPADSIVGHLDTEPEAAVAANSAVYNLVPEDGVAAELGFLDLEDGTHVIDAGLVPTPEGYILRAVAHELPQLQVWNALTTLYGDPAAKNGGASLPQAMFTNPSQCSGKPLVSTVYVDSWAHPGAFYADGTPDVEGGGWASKQAESPAVSGCNALSFNPTEFTFGPEPSHSQADEPSGYESVVKVPQSETPDTLATSPLKTTVVTLPAGTSISPSAANGLQGCTAAQFGFEGENAAGVDEFTPDAQSCPGASKVGTVEVQTPLLEERLTEGSVYVAQPTCGGAGQPACTEALAEEGKLFAIYLEVANSARGLHLKLVGKVEVGGNGSYSHEHGLAPGQIRTSFIETPQAPFNELRLKFNGGPRAPLANPQSCGTFTTNASFEPWSHGEAGGGEGTPNATMTPSFNISGGCGGVFGPSFTAGTTNPQAGAYTPFTTTFARQDGEQDLSGVEVKMPEGLLGRIAGFTQCAEAEANAGTCPASSKIGTATAAAGSGSEPFWQSGNVYLTGPYNGGPFGLSVVVPAVAGPYNLGNIVVRASIRINPSTAAATIVSNPLPQSVDGVPLRVQTVNVTVGQENNFTFNATSCPQSSIGAMLGSAQGAIANVSSTYATANCQALKFAPQFSASTSGVTSKADGASLTVKIGYPQPQTAYANIAKVDISLPLALPSRLTTLQKACTEAQFNTNPAGCPAESDVGTATVHTPLLNSPLVGPAYFVSHGGAAFPNLEMVLQGENGVKIDLVGNTDIKNGITYSKFESAPDAPISSFEFNAPEGPFSILTANGNLCAPTKTVTTTKKETKRVKLRSKGHTKYVTKKVTVKTTKTEPEPLVMPTALTAQNGTVVTQNTPIEVTGCPAAVKPKPKPTTKVKKHKKGKKGKKKK